MRFSLVLLVFLAIGSTSARAQEAASTPTPMPETPATSAEIMPEPALPQAEMDENVKAMGYAYKYYQEGNFVKALQKLNQAETGVEAKAGVEAAGAAATTPAPADPAAPTSTTPESTMPPVPTP